VGNGGNEVLGVVRRSSVIWRGGPLRGSIPWVHRSRAQATLTASSRTTTSVSRSPMTGARTGPISASPRTSRHLSSSSSPDGGVLARGAMFRPSGSRTLAGGPAALSVSIRSPFVEHWSGPQGDDPIHPGPDRLSLEPRLPDTSRLPRDGCGHGSSLVDG
jgi:hypothetical protein